MKRINLGKAAVIAGSALIAFGVAVPASAAENSPVQVRADLNGDGQLETVDVTAYDDTRQLLRTVVDGTTWETLVTYDSYAGVQPPRVVDLGGDGRDELVVTESVGANTTYFSAWDLGPAGWRQLTTPDRKPLQLVEGGGIAAHAGYTCLDDHDGRELVTVIAEGDLTADPITYTGKRTSYLVADGVATPVSSSDITNEPREAPALQVDPDLCA